MAFTIKKNFPLQWQTAMPDPLQTQFYPLPDSVVGNISTVDVDGNAIGIILVNEAVGSNANYKNLPRGVVAIDITNFTVNVKVAVAGTNTWKSSTFT